MNMTKSLNKCYFLDDQDYFFRDLPEVEYKVSKVKIEDTPKQYWMSMSSPCKDLIDSSVKCIGCNLCIVFGCFFFVIDLALPKRVTKRSDI